MIPGDFAFQDPAAAYLLLVLPLFLLLLWNLFWYRHKTLQPFGESLIPRSPAIYWCKCLALMLAWTGATFALMGPRGNGHYPVGPHKTGSQMNRRVAQELILLVDCSGSMAVADSRSGMTRLDYAKDIADQIVSKLTGEAVSLNAFTSEVTSLSPATMDYLFVRLMLRQMRINEGDSAGTNLVKALKEMHQQMLSMPPGRLKRLVLMSDGGDTALEALSDQEREKEIATVLNEFDAIKQLHIDAIGMGSSKGGVVPDVTFEGRPVYSALESELMRRLARRTGGQYIEANAATAPEIADQLIARLQQDASQAEGEERMPSSQSRTLLYDRYFQIPLALSLLLLFFALGWPDTRGKA